MLRTIRIVPRSWSIVRHFRSASNGTIYGRMYSPTEEMQILDKLNGSTLDELAK